MLTRTYCYDNEQTSFVERIIAWILGDIKYMFLLCQWLAKLLRLLYHPRCRRLEMKTKHFESILSSPFYFKLFKRTFICVETSICKNSYLGVKSRFFGDAVVLTRKNMFVWGYIFWMLSQQNETKINLEK